MTTPPDRTVLLLTLLYAGIGFAILLPMTAVRLVRHAITKTVLRRLAEQNARRAQRVCTALLDASHPRDNALMPVTDCHGFAEWITLLPSGAVKVGIHVYEYNSRFTAEARDESNILRAEVISLGDGHLLIKSHGETFSACFKGDNWDVTKS
jgi:hypothetical protein